MKKNELREWENIFAQHISDKDFYLEYAENSRNRKTK